jgi:kinesin family member 5
MRSCSTCWIVSIAAYDVASKSRLEIKEDRLRGIFIQNCTEVSVGNAEQMLKHMDSGSNNRKVAFTGMN